MKILFFIQNRNTHKKKFFGKILISYKKKADKKSFFEEILILYQKKHIKKRFLRKFCTKEGTKKAQVQKKKDTKKAHLVYIYYNLI